MQTLADCGLDGTLASEVISVIRSYPIRVGNVVEGGVEVGNSGGFGGKELSWAEVTERSGYPYPLEERTTVTQRVRRVFEMDFERLTRMAMVTRPTHIALTFADYIDYSLVGKSDYRWGQSPKLESFLGRVNNAVDDWANDAMGVGAEVAIVKTGPDDSHTFEI
jgi:hypothetical protein